MNGVNVNEPDYERLKILGITVLFTCLRIDRNTVPEGLYAYDLRHDDDCQGNICEIKPFVTVNHWGTILSKKPISMSDGGCRYVTEDDYSYTGESCTLAEFLEDEQGVNKHQKPLSPIIGADGNIFNILGIAARSLKHAGLGDAAKEMQSRVTSSGSYSEALAIISEYVEPVNADEWEPEETMELEGY